MDEVQPGETHLLRIIWKEGLLLQFTCQLTLYFEVQSSIEAL